MELVIVDDASSDHTPEVARAVGRRRPGPLHPQRGVSSGRVGAATGASPRRSGDLLGFCDDDDAWLPGAARSRCRPLRVGRRGRGGHLVARGGPRPDRPDGIVPGAAGLRGRPPPLVRSRGHPLRRHPPGHVRRRPRPSTPACASCEDWDLWLRCAQTRPIATIPRALYSYHQHGGERVTRRGFGPGARPPGLPRQARRLDVGLLPHLPRAGGGRARAGPRGGGGPGWRPTTGHRPGPRVAAVRAGGRIGGQRGGHAPAGSRAPGTYDAHTAGPNGARWTEGEGATDDRCHPADRDRRRPAFGHQLDDAGARQCRRRGRASSSRTARTSGRPPSTPSAGWDATRCSVRVTSHPPTSGSGRGPSTAPSSPGGRCWPGTSSVPGAEDRIYDGRLDPVTWLASTLARDPGSTGGPVTVGDQPADRGQVHPRPAGRGVDRRPSSTSTSCSCSAIRPTSWPAGWRSISRTRGTPPWRTAPTSGPATSSPGASLCPAPSRWSG